MLIVLPLQGVAINFVKSDDIEQFYGTQVCAVLILALHKYCTMAFELLKLHAVC